MGCSLSRPELWGRNKEPSLLSFNQRDLDDISRRDRNNNNNNQSLSAKFLMKQIVGRNSVSSEKKDFVLGGSNELLLPEKEEGLKQPPSSQVPNEHTTKPSLHDPHAAPGYGASATNKSSNPGKSENPRMEPPQHTKTNSHERNEEDLEEKGAVIPQFDGPLWIASPSFRDYCNVVPDGDPVSDDDSSTFAKGNDDPDNRINRENFTHITKDTEISIHHHDSPSPTIKKKINLKKVLTLHRPGRVRNFFGAATCYNPPPPSAAHNVSRKPRGKTV